MDLTQSSERRGGASLIHSLSLALMLLLMPFWTATESRGDSKEAQKIDCLTCHEDLLKNLPVVHEAVKLGCETCHSAIDAGEIPHKKTNNSPKGLAEEQPDLCYGCHDKTKFMNRKSIHLAIGMGCTECHNPHASKNPKLLISQVPDACFKCHARGAFSKKNTHPPSAKGKCLTCHDPHASDNISLLIKEPAKLCLDCHASAAKKKHTSAGHLVEKADTQDPKRPMKPFYCGSCHNPHTSDSRKLFRYKADSETELCAYCHDF